jgi:hypothetical protein
MPRVYSAVFAGVAVTAAQDLFELNAPSTGVVEILSCRLGQSSDYGNTEAEGLRIGIHRSTGASGSGGSAPTARPHNPLDTAYAGTVEANNTTVATTLTQILSDVWNIQAGWLYVPIPEERIVIPPSGRLVFNLPAAPADSLTMSGTLTWQVLG